MTKPTPFTCYLCTRAGRKTLAPRAKKRWTICEDCDATLAVSGRRWCNVGRHAVAHDNWTRNQCRACASAYIRRTRNVAKDRARYRAWYATNKDKVLTRLARRYQEQKLARWFR